MLLHGHDGDDQQVAVEQQEVPIRATAGWSSRHAVEIAILLAQCRAKQMSNWPVFSAKLLPNIDNPLAKATRVELQKGWG